MSDLKCKPRAWILEPKVQRHPPRHIIREVSAVEPTQAQRELADLDGDRYVPLYEIGCRRASLEKLRHALLSKMCEALAKQHDTADNAWGKSKRDRHYCDASSALDSIRQSTAAALEEYDRLSD